MTEPPYAAWSDQQVVAFYAHERHTLDNLYESERAILEPAAAGAGSVLDVGCAAGGFYPILRGLHPGIRYRGVDAVPEMVATARRRFPTVPFEVNDGKPLPYSDGAFELVLCTSVLHHNPDYQRMMQELYRVASRGCVMDLPRLVAHPYTFDRSTSYMRLAQRFGSGTMGDQAQQAVPYVLCEARSIFEFLMGGLDPRPSALAAVGYYGEPDRSTVLPVKRVCFCVVYLAKGTAATQRTKAFLELPEEIAAQFPMDRVERLDGDRKVLRELMTHA
jgi:ubiquinone/menaquinone biosynthesis C-methylase UbiE